MKAKYILPLLAAVVILAGLAVVSFILPDTEFSANENRYLQQAPQLTGTTLLDGSFTEDTEDYLADQIVGHDFWVGAASVLRRAAGAKEINDTYIGRGGYYFAAVTQDDFDADNYTDNLDYIAQLFGNNPDKTCRILLAPSPGVILSDRLPAAAQLYDSDACFAEAQAVFGEDFIDTREALLQTDDPYYRTDHHWTSMGAESAYTVWAGSVGVQARAYTLSQVTDRFRGTLYSKVLLPGSAWDAICLDDSVTIESMDCDGEIYDSLYDWKKLEEKDCYQVFMSGNHAKAVIETGASTGRSLLLIKDSFANCFVPYLCAHYDTITVIDLRYCRETVQDLADGCTDILVLYEMSNFAADSNIVRAAVS